MSNKINHRNRNKLKVDRRYPSDQYHNGYARHDIKASFNDGELIEPNGVDEKQDQQRVGRTGYLDKTNLLVHSKQHRTINRRTF